MNADQSAKPNPRKYGVLITILAIICLVALCGCETTTRQDSLEVDESEDAGVAIPDLEISPTDDSPIVGRWEVVDYVVTPVAALDELEAMDWLGQLVVYSKNAVGFKSELCDAPSFEEHQELFDDYFADYEIDPTVFGIAEPEIDVISIQCEGLPWTGPGSELIHVRGDSIVVVYDGVFLSMERY